MSNRNIMFMTVFVLAGMGILLLINVTALFQRQESKVTYVSPSDVRGSSVNHKNKEWTLNFSQQNALIAYLNQSIPISGGISNTRLNRSLDIQKITLYKFNAPNILITPIGYENDNLVFSAPEWNKEGLLKDTSHGKLKTMLFKTFDP